MCLPMTAAAPPKGLPLLYRRAPALTGRAFRVSSPSSIQTQTGGGRRIADGVTFVTPFTGRAAFLGIAAPDSIACVPQIPRALQAHAASDQSTSRVATHLAFPCPDLSVTHNVRRLKYETRGVNEDDVDSRSTDHDLDRCPGCRCIGPVLVGQIRPDTEGMGASGQLAGVGSGSRETEEGLRVDFGFGPGPRGYFLDASR